MLFNIERASLFSEYPYNIWHSFPEMRVMAIPNSGKIQITPLPEVLDNLRQRKVTGTLTIRSGAIAKSIHVKAGQIIFATSTDASDRPVKASYGPVNSHEITWILPFNCTKRTRD